jgi:F-box protein 25/32
MPFISKDWRSPGEEWVRYEGGWELKKTISVKNQQYNVDLPSFDDQKSDTQVVRLVHISYKDPKEKIVLKIPYCTY